MTEILLRDEWGAKPALRVRRWSAGKPTAVRIHHGGAFYDAHAKDGSVRDPGAILRSVQVQSFAKGHSDVMYNAFVVPYFNADGEPDALIACGRGFEYVGSANGSTLLNEWNLAICVIGNYVTPAEWERMSPEQRSAQGGRNSFFDNANLSHVVREAVDLAIYSNGSITDVGPHRDIRATVCPGGQIVDCGRFGFFNVRGAQWVEGGRRYG